VLGTCVLPLCSTKPTGTTKSWKRHRPKASSTVKVLFSSSKHANTPKDVEDVPLTSQGICMEYSSESGTDTTSSSGSSSSDSMIMGGATLSGTIGSAVSADLPKHTVAILKVIEKSDKSSSDDSSVVSSGKSMSTSTSESSIGVMLKESKCSDVISRNADSDDSSVVSLSDSVSTSTSESSEGVSLKGRNSPIGGNNPPAEMTRAVVGTINHAGLKVGENRNAVVDSWLSESVVAARANGDAGFVPSVAMGKRFAKQFNPHFAWKNDRHAQLATATLDKRATALLDEYERDSENAFGVVRSQNDADSRPEMPVCADVELPILAAANGSTEPPHCVTAADVFANGSCAANDQIPATKAEVIARLIPITNRPLDRPYDKWTLPVWKPPTKSIQPRAGHPEDTFVTATFTAEVNGPYIADVLLKEYGGAKSVEWTSTRIFEEWVKAGTTAVNDMVQRRSADLAGNAGSHTDVGKLFFIHPEAICGGGQFTWDYREWIEAWERDAPAEEMMNICVSWVDEEEPVVMDLNKVRMLHWLDRVGSTDDYMRWQVQFGFTYRLKPGVKRQIAFRPQAASQKFHTEFCEGIADEEGCAGITSSTIIDDTDGVPVRMPKFYGLPPFSGQNFACGVSESSNKLRSLTDMTGAADLKYFMSMNGEDADDYSLNANIDMGEDASAFEMRHKLHLPSSRTFCLAVAVLVASGLRVKIGKMDWSGFYRQIIHSKRCTWFAIKLMSARGYTHDRALPFGNRKGPEIGNELNDVVVIFIRFEFRSRVDSKNAEIVLREKMGILGADDADWCRQWALVEVFIVERRAIIAASFPDLSTSEVAEQCEIEVWHGFYDDGSFCVFEFLFDFMVRTALDVAHDIGLKVSIKKTECGTMDGTCGVLDPKAWAEGILRWNMGGGCMTVLGKEIDLQHCIERDTFARVVGFKIKLKEMRESRNVRMVSRSNKRGLMPRRITVERADISTDRSQRLIGLTFFMIRTEPSLRALMNWPVRLHRAAYAIWSRSQVGVRLGASKNAFRDRCERCIYTDEVDDIWLELETALEMRRGVTFMAASPVPGSGGRRVVRVMADAAGQQTKPGLQAEMDPEKVVCTDDRGGGSWFWDPAGDIGGEALQWHFWPWCKHMLVMHSTFLEGANCLTGIHIAVAKMGAEDIVVHMDSNAWVCVTRRNSAKSESVAPLVRQMSRMLAMSGVRLFVVHQKRELGQLADGISKKEMVAVNAEMSARGLCELSPERRVADDTVGLSELMALLRGLAVVEANNGLQRLLSSPQ